MSFGTRIFGFYRELKIPEVKDLPVKVMLPYESEEVQGINERFYDKYYNDENERTCLIGINPGRFGGGITGIPFTDPVNLAEVLKIENDFSPKHELSSQFIYSVIKKMGGPEIFFGKFYMTAVSPVGFIKNNKNVNYYEVKELRESWEPFFVDSLRKQITAGLHARKAFILGSGENAKFLSRLNSMYNLFGELSVLPHPRWVMQYRYRQRDKYAGFYIERLSSQI